MFDWLIVGAGFTGCVLAERLASQFGDLVLLLDRRSHIGGNSYDRFDAMGLRRSVYGLHVLQTEDTRVLDYLSRFTGWHEAERNAGRDLYTPLRAVSGPAMRGVGESVERDGDASRRPVAMPYSDARASAVPAVGEVREKLVGKPLVPADGYTQMFDRMLSHHNIKLMLNTDYTEVRDIIPFRRLIYTGPIDEYFEYCYGKLPYQAIPADEHGYPLTAAGGDGLYRRYEELARSSAAVFFLGRLATYKYLTMGDVVGQALAAFDRISDASRSSERDAVVWTASPPAL
ncbi:MAG: NAD(P)-binding protein [Rhodospirillales bacterium]|nr:NAD(P)-binding protein [Rhodospirillales bacterium]